MVKDLGFGELIPNADAIIFDEAHQLPDLASHYFGYRLSSRQLIFLAREIMHTFQTEVKDMVQLQKCAAKLDNLAQESVVLFDNGGVKGNLKHALHNPAIANFMKRLLSGLSFYHEVLKMAFRRNKILENCLEYVDQYIHILDRLKHSNETEYSAMYEFFANQVIFSLIPISIKEPFTK